MEPRAGKRQGPVSDMKRYERLAVTGIWKRPVFDHGALEGSATGEFLFSCKGSSA